VKRYALLAVPIVVVLALGLFSSHLLQAEGAGSFTVLQANQIVKAPVTGAQGQNLGQIVDLIVDVQGGQTAAGAGPAAGATPQGSPTPNTSSGAMIPGNIRYAILALGGSSGSGDNGAAVPWSYFTYRPAQKDFVVTVSAGQISNAPRFNGAVGAISPIWEQSVQAYWQRVGAQAPAGTPSATASAGSSSSGTPSGTPSATTSAGASSSSSSGTPSATPSATTSASSTPSGTPSGVVIYGMPATAQVATATPTFTPLPGADSLVGQLPNINSVAQGAAAGGVGEAGHDPGISIGTHLSRSTVIPTPPVSTFGEGVIPAATASIGGEINANPVPNITPTYGPEGQSLGAIRPGVVQPVTPTQAVAPQEETHAETPIVTQMPTPVPSPTPGPTATPTPAATTTPTSSPATTPTTTAGGATPTGAAFGVSGAGTQSSTPTAATGTGTSAGTPSVASGTGTPTGTATAASSAGTSGATPSPSATSQPSPAGSTMPLNVNAILGAPVEDAGGTQAGNVTNLLAEVSTSGGQATGSVTTTPAATGTMTSATFAGQGGVAYAVVTIHNNGSSKQVLVPWGLLTYQPATKSFRASATLAVLQKAPGPGALGQGPLNAPGWDSSIRSYWQAQASGTPAPTATP
jgi:hypothetical protein